MEQSAKQKISERTGIIRTYLLENHFSDFLKYATEEVAVEHVPAEATARVLITMGAHWLATDELRNHKRTLDKDLAETTLATLQHTRGGPLVH